MRVARGTPGIPTQAAPEAPSAFDNSRAFNNMLFGVKTVDTDMANRAIGVLSKGLSPTDSTSYEEQSAAIRNYIGSYPGQDAMTAGAKAVFTGYLQKLEDAQPQAPWTPAPASDDGWSYDG